MRSDLTFIKPSARVEQAAVRSSARTVHDVSARVPECEAGVCEATFSANVRQRGQTVLSWARAWVAETAIRLRLSCSSALERAASAGCRRCSARRWPSRSLLVRSSRSAASTLMRRTAWPMSVAGVWLTGAPRSLKTGSSSARPGVEPGGGRGEPVDARP